MLSYLQNCSHCTRVTMGLRATLSKMHSSAFSRYIHAGYCCLQILPEKLGANAREVVIAKVLSLDRNLGLTSFLRLRIRNSHSAGRLEGERLHQLDVVAVVADHARQTALADRRNLCWEEEQKHAVMTNGGGRRRLLLPPWEIGTGRETISPRLMRRSGSRVVTQGNFLLFFSLHFWP